MGRDCACCGKTHEGGGSDPCLDTCVAWNAYVFPDFPYPNPIARVDTIKSDSNSVTVDIKVLSDSMEFKGNEDCKVFSECFMMGWGRLGPCWHRKEDKFYSGLPAFGNIYTDCFGNTEWCGLFGSSIDLTPPRDWDYSKSLFGFPARVFLSGMKKISPGKYIVTISGADSSACQLYFSKFCGQFAQGSCDNNEEKFNYIPIGIPVGGGLPEIQPLYGDVPVKVTRGPTSAKFNSCDGCKTAPIERPYPYEVEGRIIMPPNVNGTDYSFTQIYGDLTFAFLVEEECYMYVTARGLKYSKVTTTKKSCNCSTCEPRYGYVDNCGCGYDTINRVTTGDSFDVPASRTCTNPDNFSFKFLIEGGQPSKFECKSKIKGVHQNISASDFMVEPTISWICEE
jgi:hypothetical protein